MLSAVSCLEIVAQHNSSKPQTRSGDISTQFRLKPKQQAMEWNTKFYMNLNKDRCFGLVFGAHKSY